MILVLHNCIPNVLNQCFANVTRDRDGIQPLTYFKDSRARTITGMNDIQNEDINHRPDTLGGADEHHWLTSC